MGWSRSPLVETCVPCVRVCVRVHALVPRVSMPCVPGAQFLVHTCAASCVQACPVIAPLSGSCLGGCWAGHWPYWYMSPLTLGLHVPGWGSPPVSLLCVGMCGSMSKIFSVPGGRCVSLHVFHHWPGYLCQSQHGCPGRVWMWVVCKWGKGVSVCEWASWNPTMCETPLGWQV